jgi:hypothetical protein
MEWALRGDATLRIQQGDMTMMPKLVARQVGVLSLLALGTLSSSGCGSGPENATDPPAVTPAAGVATAPPGVVLGDLVPGRYNNIKNVVLHGQDPPSVTEYWVSETERKTALDPNHSYMVESAQITPCPNGMSWELFDEPDYGGNSICFSGSGAPYLPDYSDDFCFWTGFQWICTIGRNWENATRSWQGNSEIAHFDGLTPDETFCQTPPYHESCFGRFCVLPSNLNVDPTAIAPGGVGDGCAYYSYALVILN